MPKKYILDARYFSMNQMKSPPPLTNSTLPLISVSMLILIGEG